uniref:Uncharacterized protein n=1 Tax=Terrapene triunguis TaxID=2587831 RepID=A0A674JIU6_9SAUR
ISLQKFQQKALKQTKQKKSKSAEFLMVKEERAATEVIENPAFNISSTDLSAYQTSEEKVIRHDKLDSTLAAHQQKLRLQAHAEPRGNEYSRNYFDPVMDEEINPRQSGMEVSGEAHFILDNAGLLHSSIQHKVTGSYVRVQERVVSGDISSQVMAAYSVSSVTVFCQFFLGLPCILFPFPIQCLCSMSPIWHACPNHLSLLSLMIFSNMSSFVSLLTLTFVILSFH